MRFRMLVNMEGQAGLLSVLLIVLLMIMVIGVTGILQTMSRRSVTQIQKDIALNAAQSGANFGAKALAAGYATWHNALDPEIDGGSSAPIIATYPSPFDSTAPVPLPLPGQSYWIHGNSAPDSLMGFGMYRYTAEACVTGYEGAAQQSLDVGYRAESLSLRLPNGLLVSPAVILDHDPGPATASNHPENFHVHGGPLVVFDSLSLPPTSDMVAQHYPRKFSKGPMSFEPPGEMTDNIEFWQDANLGKEPTVNLTGSGGYLNAAQATPLDPAVGDACPGTHSQMDFSLTGNCAMNTPLATNSYGYKPYAWLNPPPTVPLPGPTLYLQNPAATTTLGKVTLLSPSYGNLIVEGSLVLDNGGVAPAAQAPAASGIPSYFFNEIMGVAPAAWREYPHGTPLANALFGATAPACWDVSDPSYPCQDKSRGSYMPAYPLTGASAHGQTVSVQGLMYVGGDLNVVSGTWLIDGVLIVKGHVTIAAGAQLYVYYDDTSAQFIPTSPLTVTTVYERPVSSCDHFAFSE